MRRLDGKMIYVAIYVDDSLITGSDTKGIAYANTLSVRSGGHNKRHQLVLESKPEVREGRKWTREAPHLLQEKDLRGLQTANRPAGQYPYYDDHTSTMKMGSGTTRNDTR